MNATPKRPYKMIGKDGDAFVVCQPDKHGKHRTIAHVYDADPAYQIVRAVNSYDAMREALEEIIRNVEPWKTADNMAGRLHEIASNALAVAKGEQDAR